MVGIGAGAGLLDAVDRDEATLLVDQFLASAFHDPLGQLQIELLADVQQRPSAGHRVEIDIEILNVWIGVDCVDEQVLEEEVAHPAEIALGQAGSQLG